MKGATLGLICGFIFSLNQILFEQDLYIMQLGNNKVSTFMASVLVMMFLSVIGYFIECIINKMKES